jgi:RNA polymerase-binding transcription factor DksA
MVPERGHPEQDRAHLRQFECLLIHVLQNSYGICRECRQAIPSPQLKREPVALLCAACIEGAS